MIHLQRKFISGVQAAKSGAELRTYLQKAIELEHATIPPYLSAMYSLVPGFNDEIAGLIRSVVIEEMLHMTISANVLIAIGGCPKINDPAFVPEYPATLPMGIADDLIIPIAPFSIALVRDVFMKIEEPEDPIPVRLESMAEGEEAFGTIGEFYEAIQKKIVELGDSIFVKDSATRQVLSWFEPDRLFPIVDVASANKALGIIIVEGEGTSTDPFESPGKPAHYYRFGEIVHGRKIVETSDGGYAWAGDPIPYDKAGVYPFIENPEPSDYLPGSHAETLSTTFSFSYSGVLNRLHECFNGAPETINAAMGLMFQLRLQAQTLMMTPAAPGSPRTIGPVFRYVTNE